MAYIADVLVRKLCLDIYEYRQRTKLYDKKDDFSFKIVCFIF